MSKRVTFKITYKGGLENIVFTNITMSGTINTPNEALRVAVHDVPANAPQSVMIEISGDFVLNDKGQGEIHLFIGPYGASLLRQALTGVLRQHGLLDEDEE